MNLASVFRPLIELEKSLNSLYSSWAEVFASDAEAAFVFFKMSREESGHASLIEYQRRVVQQNQTLSTEVDLDLTLLNTTIEGIRQLRNQATPPTLNEAIDIALKLEHSAAETHYKNAIKQANPDLGRLLNALGGDDTAHVKRLTEFAKKRGVAVPVAS